MRRSPLLALALCGALSACSPATTPTPSPASASATPSTSGPTGGPPVLRPVADATAFDAGNALRIRAKVGPALVKDTVVGDRTALVGTTLFGINRAGQLLRVPVATGEASWALDVATPSPGQPTPTPGEPWADDKGPGSPLVSTDGLTVYAALGQTIWGPKDVMGVAAVAVDSLSGKERWRVLLPLKLNLLPADAQRITTSLTSNGLLVVTPTESILLDPATGKTVWQTDGWVALGNGRMGLWAAPGGASSAWVFDAGTGKRTDVPAVQKSPAAPTWIGEAGGNQVFTVPGSPPTLVVMDAAAGTVKSKFSHWAFDDCQHLEPGSQLTVCSPGDSLSGVDVLADKPVWSFQKPKMVVPTQPFRLGNVVYGVVDGKGVALELSTGKTLSADTGAKVFRANAYGGLALAPGLVFAPAKQP